MGKKGLGPIQALALKKYAKRKPTPLFPYKWYILDTAILENPRMLNNVFEHIEDAKRAIRQELGGLFFRYKYILGEFALKHGIKFKRNDGFISRGSHVRNYKWEYPKSILGNTQKMKEFRTYERFKIRRAKLKTQKNETINI